MVIVLSVFNGFSDLASRHFSILDPALSISRQDGTVIANADSLAQALSEIEGVARALPVIERRGLLIGDNAQTGVIFKAVPPEYAEVTDISRAFVAQSGVDEAFLGENTFRSDIAVGVANHLSLRPGDGVALYVPDRFAKYNPANAAAAFRKKNLFVDGVFRVDQLEIDADHIYIPLEAGRQLLSYDHEASAIEIAPRPGTKLKNLTRTLQSNLGEKFIVADQAIQHAESFKMIAVEKWITFYLLIFILVIASFNIVSTLSLIVIEKRHNMSTLLFLGARPRQVRGIFLWLGAIITLIGGAIGMALGSLLTLLQQHFGLIKLGADPSAVTINTYPARLASTDLTLTAVIIIGVALAAALSTLLFTKRNADSFISSNDFRADTFS